MGTAQRPPERYEGPLVVVVAVHIAKQGEQMAQGPPIIDPAGLLYPVRGVLAELRQIPP